MTNLTRKGLPKHKEVHESHKSLKFPESLSVNEIPYNDYIFVSDSQETKPIKEQFRFAKDYDSFFVSKKDLEHGDITHVYAIEGTVPYNDKRAILLRRK